MTRTAPGAPVGVPVRRPALARPREGRLIGGVAAGTAAHLRLDPLAVRVGFAALAVTGIGLVAYALLWLSMPVGVDGDQGPAPAAPAGPRQLAGLVLLGIGAFALLGQLQNWLGYDVVLPLVLGSVGLAVIWRQLDAAAPSPSPPPGGSSPVASRSLPALSCCSSPPPASWPTPGTGSSRRW